MFTAEQEQRYKAAIARLWQGNRVIGAGVLIAEGYLLTCAHVVEQALRWSEDALPIDKLVTVDFPLIPGSRKQKAQVLRHRVDNEDAACLRLLEPSPLGTAPISLSFGQSWNDSFAVLGFPKKYRKGSWAKGEFSGAIVGQWIQIEATRAQGYSIKPGYSGAPVWSTGAKSIVGIAVAHDKENEEARVAFMIPARSLSAITQVVERLSLMDILESAAIAPVMLDEAYQVCCLEARNHELVPETLDGKLSQLQNMNDGGMDYPVYQQFIAYFLRPEIGLPDDLGQRLRSWLSARVDDVDALIAVVNQRYEVRMAAKTKLASSHLLVWVYEDDNRLQVDEAIYIPEYDKYDSRWGAGSRKLKAPDDFEWVDMITLPKLVRRCIDEASEIKPPGRLTIELFLPVSQLNQDVDKWDSEDPDEVFIASQPLGCFCRVVVRSAERLDKRYKKYEGKWREKWQAVQDYVERPVRPGFIVGDGRGYQQLVADLAAEKIIGLQLVEAAEYKEKQNPLLAVLATGAPAAIWLRKKVLDKTPLDKILSCCTYTLLDEIGNTRLKAFSAPPELADRHVGHHLSFLWEDPQLVPPSTYKFLNMPQP